jgi:hypothetical protein
MVNNVIGNTVDAASDTYPQRLSSPVTVVCYVLSSRS